MAAKTLTLTGIDERTDISAVAKLDAEIGILYTCMPAGRPRYPRKEWIIETLGSLPNAAVHFCGRQARENLIHGWLDDMVDYAKRIQVNGPLDVRSVEKLCRMFPSKAIITQHKPDNKELLSVAAENHAILVDSSGGRGVSPIEWVRPNSAKRTGYAGGLGPDNLDAEMFKIAGIDDRDWWVDMENKLRIDDWFSIERATQVCEIFKAAVIA